MESMLKTPLEDADGCLRELEGLGASGAELVRIAFPSEALSQNLRAVTQKTPIPIMADIHFNHKLAILAIDCGIRSIRINPGNMSGREGLMNVLSAARANGAVVRIGSNGGSLSAKQIAHAGGDRAMALVHAVEEQLVPILETGFCDIVISAKSSSVPETVRANHILAQRYPYPMHIGITEAGPGRSGAVKSAAGLGILLAQGIGDTMRVSLTEEGRAEVEVAYDILRSLGLRLRGVDLISCPGCGRRRVDVAELARSVRAMLPESLPDGTTVAVMGCEVNGPKEAAAADIGIAGTQSGFVLFERGTVITNGERSDLTKTLSAYFAKYETQT